MIFNEDDFVKDKKIFAVDLDGVLCHSESDYNIDVIYHRKPIQKNIDKVNELYAQGHVIIIYTARNLEWQMVTEHWHIYCSSIHRPYFQLIAFLK